MGERSNILYKLVRLPAFYSLCQSAICGHRSRIKLVEQLVRPQSGMSVLDLGCGPGIIRPFLKDVDYIGVDMNAHHINSARKKGQPGDQYFVGDVITTLSFEHGKFDLILLMGILHHIDDDDARTLLQHLAVLLKNGGRIVTFDGVYFERQRVISRLMLDWDAGKNVRTAKEYQALCEGGPLDAEVTIFNDLLRIPYDHCAMTLTHKPG